MLVPLLNLLSYSHCAIAIRKHISPRTKGGKYLSSSTCKQPSGSSLLNALAAESTRPKKRLRSARSKEVVSPAYKRAEGRASVWGSEFSTKFATL
jgi:hypothetical protein